MRQRIREEKERLIREASDGITQWMIRYGQAQAQAIALMAISGFRTFYYCDLELACVSQAELDRREAKKVRQAIDTRKKVFDNLTLRSDTVLRNLETRLIGLDGSTLIGLDGATLIGLDGSTLIGNDGSTLIGNDGSTLIGNDGSTLIGNDGSTFKQ